LICGRWGKHQKKTRVEQCHVIDAARWQREGILHPGSTSSRPPVFCVGYRVDAIDMSIPRVHLMYSIKQQRFEYPVNLLTTRPHLGGLRWWFVCLLCERRAQKLYLPPDADRFGCRTCHNLSYASRSYTAKNRSMERARKIQVRLGGSASLFDRFPAKPKRMWSKTYQRLWKEFAVHHATMIRLLMEQVEKRRPST
jgi:hypothetical protein